IELILQQAFDDVGDLFARMAVRGECHSGGEVDADLDHLAAGDAEIVPREISALDSLLRQRDVRRQTACDDQRRDCYDSIRFHLDLLSSFKSKPSDQRAGRTDQAASAMGVARKLIAMRLKAFIRPIAIVRSASCFSSNTADAASNAPSGTPWSP